MKYKIIGLTVGMMITFGPGIKLVDSEWRDGKWERGGAVFFDDWTVEARCKVDHKWVGQTLYRTPGLTYL
jgi:hypothetical protein